MSFLFSTLWESHPTVLAIKKRNSTIRFPCNQDEFQHQCAIRMGVCLKACGVSLASFPGVRCWFHSKSLEHILRAEELAKWLATSASPIKGVNKYKTKSQSLWSLRNRTGIIFFKNFWGPGNSGDHIDLWNGSRMTATDSAPLVTRYASKAKEVWFWQIH